MRKLWMVFVSVFLAVGLIAPATAKAGQFRFPVGLTYASGPQKVMDKMKENYNIASDFVLPVGIAFNPYYESDIGLGIGASVGPFTYMAVDAGGTTSDNIILPLGADIRYTLFRKDNVSPYARVGFRYPLATGDYLESKGAGFFGGAGVEFLRTKNVSVALEFSYDSSKIEVKAGELGARPGTRNQEVTPCGFMGGIFAVF